MTPPDVPEGPAPGPDEERVDNTDLPDPSPPEGDEFARVTLRGDRFEHGRLPVDALVELDRYRQILLEAAIRAWRTDNPTEPLPQDFESAFDLAIVRIEEGSATSVLERPIDDYSPYFERARDATEAAFQAIVAADPALLELMAAPVPSVASDAPAEPPADDPAEGDSPEQVVRRLSAELLREFSSSEPFRTFGSTLREGEEVAVQEYLAGPDYGTDQEVVITPAIRQHRMVPFLEQIDDVLHPAPRRRRDRLTDGEVAGRLISINAEARRFRLRTLAFGEITGRYRSSALTTDLRGVLESNALAPVVRVAGRLRYSPAGDVTEILDATGVELFELDEEPWTARLVDLASMARGWANEETGEGSVVNFAALDAARDLIREARDSADAPLPGIFLMTDGGVHVEWANPRRVTSVEIAADGEFVVYDLEVVAREDHETVTYDISVARAALLGALQGPGDAS